MAKPRRVFLIDACAVHVLRKLPNVTSVPRSTDGSWSLTSIFTAFAQLYSFPHFNSTASGGQFSQSVGRAPVVDLEDLATAKEGFSIPLSYLFLLT